MTCVVSLAVGASRHVIWWPVCAHGSRPQELVRTIVGLSYGGDVRLAVGAEDPHKVARIAEGSWEALHGTYVPLMQVGCWGY